MGGHGTSIPAPVLMPVEHHSWGNSSTAPSGSSWTRPGAWRPRPRPWKAWSYPPPCPAKRHAACSFGEAWPSKGPWPPSSARRP